MLGLDIDREGAARLDVRVAAVIAGLGSATGQLACSAHSALIQLLGNTGESIMDEQEWQVPRLYSGECDWMDWPRKMFFPMPCSDAKQGKNAFVVNPERKC